MSGPTKQAKRPAPFPVRFTEAEKATLRERAGNKPLGAYIRERALEGAAEPRRRRKTPVRDHDALARVLAVMGQMRLANNLNQLAKAANGGALPMTSEVEAELKAACSTILEMRELLIEGLGLKVPEEPSPGLAPEFTKAAKEPQR